MLVARFCQYESDPLGMGATQWGTCYPPVDTFRTEHWMDQGMRSGSIAVDLRVNAIRCELQVPTRFTAIYP